MRWHSSVAVCGIAIALARVGQDSRGQDSSVPYITGGISEIVLSDASGVRLVNTVAVGPWFCANVPPGSYGMTAALVVRH